MGCYNVLYMYSILIVAITDQYYEYSVYTKSLDIHWWYTYVSPMEVNRLAAYQPIAWYGIK